MNKIVNNEMNEYWNGDGGHKWVRFQARMDTSLKHFGHKVMAAAAISVNENVIDIGCGCSDTTFDIAQRVGPGGYVQGLDISEPILTQARARTFSNVVSNIIFNHGDAQTYPFDVATADIVFSRFGVMFFDDPVAAFSNIRQTLKQGGRMAFICWQPAAANEWISLALDVVKNHITLPASPGPEEPGPLSLGDKNRVTHILSKAGFSHISIKRFDSALNIGANLNESIEFLTQMGPAGSALSQPDVNDMDKSRINAELRDRLTSYETDQGVALGAATWIVTARNP